MSYGYRGQLTLEDRVAIEIGICRGESFKKIALKVSKHPTTIANEIKHNRTFIKGNYWADNDCKYARHCEARNLCDEEYCKKRCAICRVKDCRKSCNRYISMACRKFESIPYVCNRCVDKRLCQKDRYFYNAKYAQAAYERRLSESRMGLRVKGEDFFHLDKLLTQLVRKGQPLTHIYSEHKDEIPVSLRSLYNYIDSGDMTIRNIDLRRKTSYRPRKRKGKRSPKGFARQQHRIGRTYEDYLVHMEKKDQDDVVEMDTVKGVRESGKRLLTMIFRKNDVMLMFLMPDGKAESVHRVFDYLEMSLGIERFRKLFPVILTDNGSEFKRVDELENNSELERRTNIYYCDPMASWQKPHIEKNHEFIRYVIPRGKTLNPYTQEDMTKLMNHINSIRRKKLGNRCPYELAQEDEDMVYLMQTLKMHLIPPDEVHLKSNLLVKK